MTYLDVVLYTSALVLALVPVFGCAFVDCTPHDGAVSISAIIHHDVLSTVYAFWGAAFLTSLTYFQIQCKKPLRILFAVLGSKLLAVPLYLPFGAVESDVYHYAFAVAGFALEFAYILCVLTDVNTCHHAPRGSGLIYFGATLATAAFVTGCVGAFSHAHTSFVRVAIFIAEYLFGFGLLVVSKTAHARHL